MILAHYEARQPLSKVRAACGPDLSAAQPAPLLKAAQSFGLKAKLDRLGAQEALQRPMPAILLMDQGAFAVLEGEAEAKVHLSSPAEGPMALDMVDFQRRFAGILIELHPGKRFGGGARSLSLLPLAFARLKSNLDTLLVVVFSSILLLLPSVAMPAFTQLFIDMVLVKNLNSWLFPIVVGLLIGVFLTSVGTAVQQYFMNRMQSQVATDTSSLMFWRALNAPVRYYFHLSVGDAVFRLGAVIRVAELLSNRMGTNFSNFITALFYLAVLVLYSIPLALITLTLTLANVASVRMVDRKRGKINATQLKQVGETYSVAVNGLKAIESLKAMAMESLFFRKQADLSSQTVGSQQSVDFLSLRLNLVPQVLTAINSGVVLALGATFVIRGQLSIGELVAFQMLSNRLAKPIQDLIASSQEVNELKERLKSCEDLIHAPVDPVLAAKPESGWNERLSGHIELRNLSFGYSSDEPPLISDLSLTIAPGSRVAITGGSGSGKTTLTKLVLGLYRPTGGTILYDGHPVEEISRPLWTASVGYVSQDIYLFEGSVRDNFTLWDETIPIEDIRQAAKDAQIDDIISSRASGYDSPVSEGGSNFSGGQRQRIEIGRALVSNPSILVLDEATSALDAETEMLVDLNLRRRGCTCLIIAHRLSTLKDADEILVLERGTVVERGTHEELLRRDGRYAQLLKLS
jgi:ATP-binding cassette subfamily C protein